MNEWIQNYDDWSAFFGEKVEKEFFKEENPMFAEKVLDYLFLEFEIDIAYFDEELQSKVLHAIEEMRNNENVPNCASRIAYEIVPI